MLLDMRLERVSCKDGMIVMAVGLKIDFLWHPIGYGEEKWVSSILS